MTSGGILSMTRLAKPWGRSNLPAVFAGPDKEPVGEVWFERPPPLETILAKYLFTEERLSVQVHPTAANCQAGSGKDECWFVTDARPGAQLAVGFRETADADEVRKGARDGTIMSMLNWIEVEKDDFIYVPAGTVHSMGEGLTLIEIQQNTDITYRLYDYGRDRALHLDEAMASIRLDPHPPELRRRLDAGSEQLLVEGPYFAVAQCIGKPSPALFARFSGPVQIMPVDGRCRIDGIVIEPGASGWSEQLDGIDFSDHGRCLIVANPLPDQLNPPAP